MQLKINNEAYNTEPTPAQKKTKLTATTYQPKTLTPDSALLPVGLDISGYDFKVNEVLFFLFFGAYLDFFEFCISLHMYTCCSHPLIVRLESTVMVFMTYFTLDTQKHWNKPRSHSRKFIY